MNALQTLQFMQLLTRLTQEVTGPEEKPELGRKIVSLVFDNGMSRETLNAMLSLQPHPENQDMPWHARFGVALLWSVSSEDPELGKYLKTAAADYSSESPFFLKGSLRKIASYFSRNAPRPKELSADAFHGPSLWDEKGRFRFDVKDYLLFHRQTLGREVGHAIRHNHPRLSVLVEALRDMDDSSLFGSVLDEILDSGKIDDLPVNDVGRRILMGRAPSSTEILECIDGLTSSILQGNVSLKEKQAYMLEHQGSIDAFLQIDEATREIHISQNLNLSSNEDLDFELHDGSHSAALVLRAIDPDGMGIFQSFASYKDQAYDSVESLLVDAINELPDVAPSSYVKNRDVWLGGMIQIRPIEKLNSLPLKSEGWYKLYQLTEHESFKAKVRGSRLDRVFSEDLGL